MTLEKFFEKLYSQETRDDYLVRLKFKYDWEDEYEEHNEFLETCNGDYMWLNDWCEGQTDVEVIGYIAVPDIEIPRLEE